MVSKKIPGFRNHNLTVQRNWDKCQDYYEKGGARFSREKAKVLGFINSLWGRYLKRTMNKRKSKSVEKPGSVWAVFIKTKTGQSG